MSELALYSLIILLIGTTVYLAKQLLIKRKKLKKYSAIIDIEKEKETQLNQVIKLKSSYEELAKRHLILKSEVKDLDDEYLILEYGLYKPRYDFNNSAKYKARLTEIRKKQKAMIKDNTAMHCATNWSVGDSVKAGEAMTKKIHKLALTAFNVECDNLIMKVKYNNIYIIEERIEKLASRIEKYLSKWGSHIVASFIQLKEEELYLVHEYKEKVQEEKEEQKEIREQMREEELAKREFDQAQKEAEKEERYYKKALDEVHKEFKLADDDEKKELEEQIKKLEAELKKAQEHKVRALSMAQQTKRGNVYIISNIGSFGENVYKIGMTRRLDPMDRVKELGDASVPFTFDVHAMIYSQNAPELEKDLHRQFSANRKNRVNKRKEFFNVSFEEIESYCNEKNLDIEFTKKAVAKEFWETKAILAKENKVQDINLSNKHDTTDVELLLNEINKAA